MTCSNCDNGMTIDEALNQLFSNNNRNLSYIHTHFNTSQQSLLQKHMKSYHAKDTQIPFTHFLTVYRNLITQINAGTIPARITIFAHSASNYAPNGLGTYVDEPMDKPDGDEKRKNALTDIFRPENHSLLLQITKYIKPKLQAAKTIVVLKSCTTSAHAAKAIAYALGVPVVHYYSFSRESIWISPNHPHEIFIKPDPIRKPDVGIPIENAKAARNHGFEVANPSDYIKDHLLPDVEQSIHKQLLKDEKYKELFTTYENAIQQLRSLRWKSKSHTKEYKDLENQIKNLEQKLANLRTSLIKKPSSPLKALLKKKSDLEKEYRDLRSNACPPQNPPHDKQQPKTPPDKGTNNFPGHRLQQQFLQFAGGRSEAWTHLLKVLQDIEKMLKEAIGGKWGGDPDGLPYGTHDWLSKLSGLVATGRHDRQMPDSVGRHVPGAFGLPGKQKPKIPTSLTDLNNNIPGKPGTSFQDLQGRTSDAPDPKKLGSKTYPSPKKDVRPDVRPNVTITPAKDFDFPSEYDPCGKFPSEDDLTEEQLQENPMTYEKCWEAIENGEEIGEDEDDSDSFSLDELLDLVGKILGDEQSANEKKGEQNLHHFLQKISSDEIEHLIDFLDQLDIPMLSPEFLEELRQDLLDYHRNTYIIPEFDMRGDPLTEEDKEKGIQRIQRQGDEIKQYSPDGFPTRNQPDVSFESLFHKTLGPRIRTSPHLEDTSLFVSGDEHSRVVKTLLSSSDTIKYHDPDSVSSGKGNAPRLEDYPDRISPRAHSQHENVSTWREFRNFPSQQRTSYRTSMSVQNHRDTSRSTHHKSWDDPDA